MASFLPMELPHRYLQQMMYNCTMRNALLLLLVLVGFSANAQQKFSTAPLPPTTTFKKLPTVGLAQRVVTQAEVNKLDSICRLFPDSKLPMYTLEYLKAAYVQYYTPEFEEYDREQGRIYFKVPYEYTQLYGAQKLTSKYEFTFVFDTLKHAWLRQIGNWPYFRRDSIFVNTTPVLFAHSPASYNVDTLRVYNGGEKTFDTKGKYGCWYLPHHTIAGQNIMVFTTPENNSFVAKIKVVKKAKQYTKGDDTLGIAKLGKYQIELDTNTVISTGQEKLTLAKNAFIATDSTFTGKLKKGKEYYVVLTDGQAVGRPEPLHLVYFALPADKPVKYIKPLKYIKLKASTGRRGGDETTPIDGP